MKNAVWLSLWDADGGGRTKRFGPFWREGAHDYALVEGTFNAKHR